ncbi:MAG: SsrA-binding protein [Parcubacteria group bacterium RIFCSPHIGHO2_02_FULL_48_10b]|nr:MAG: SsrA-binding protein [Parcubacteria group bacterium RIFCSPHIGHO2_02_FULL_48_10b]
MDLAYNRRAQFDYDVFEKLQAGIELTGHEVKSAKKGHLNLAASYIVFHDGEAFMLGMQIPSFQPTNAPPDFDAERTKKLLLKKEEMRYLAGKKQAGFSVIPVRAYTNRGLIKVEVAVARGRKKHDKRELIKKREVKREISRSLK